MNMKEFTLALIFTLSTCLCAVETDVPTPTFSDGDTVVYPGDSITHGGTFHSFVNLFYPTRMTEMNSPMVNAGVAGNQIFHAIDRSKDNVIIHNPDVIVLIPGIIDAGDAKISNHTGKVTNGGK